jgi:hypothetical protein
MAGASRREDRQVVLKKSQMKWATRGGTLCERKLSENLRERMGEALR